MDRASVFLGYPAAPPMLGETMRNSATAIARLTEVKTWEDLRIGGKPIIDEIFEAIDRSRVGVFEVTSLNENVLFELGYAVARSKVIWPLRDETVADAQGLWKRFGLLSTTGQVFYGNSDDIFARFTNERPDVQGTPFFEQELAPHLSPSGDPGLLFLSSPAQTEASRVLARVVEEEGRGIAVIHADPRETTAESLVWFAQHVYEARAVVVHFLPPTRTGFQTHNPRCALVAGLAMGMGRPVLMLAEDPYETPIDYRDHLFRYATADECRERTSYWLRRNLAPTYDELADREQAARALELSTELRSVNLGEYVAENESGPLRTYFVDTPIFHEVVTGPSRVIVGRKGSGKSATLIQAERAIRADRRTHVTVIKPAGYELTGLVRLLKQYEEPDTRGYLIESLWKYLLYSEIAISLEREFSVRPAGALPDTPEWRLFQFLGDHRGWLGVDFGRRLEGAVSRLLSGCGSSSLSVERERISELLHSGPIRQLRSLLVPALKGRDRVAILIDNLDKAWERSSDIEVLSRVILGLLGSMDSFRSDLQRPSGGSLGVTLSIFLRSDIFETLSREAREPDKLPVRRITWDEPGDLVRLVEARYLASRPSEDIGDLWSKYFCSYVRGEATPSYIANAVLPKPRDVLYLAKEAIDRAITNRHARVEEADILAAEKFYSQFAFEATVVETDITYRDLDMVLLQFAGLEPELERSAVEASLAAAGVPSHELNAVIEQLRSVSFLGVKVGNGQISFTDDRREKQKADVLSARYARTRSSEVEYGIHRAFWSYLELETTANQLRFQRT